MHPSGNEWRGKAEKEKRTLRQLSGAPKEDSKKDTRQKPSTGTQNGGIAKDCNIMQGNTCDM